MIVIGVVGELKFLDVLVGMLFEVCLVVVGGINLDEYLFLDGGLMMGKLNDKFIIVEKVVMKIILGLIVVEDIGYLYKLYY